MELSSPESMRALLQDYLQPDAGKSKVRVVRSATKDRRTHCRCGRCNQCLDDARWERIFAKKFVDPDYYTRRSISYPSPLNSL